MIFIYKKFLVCKEKHISYMIFLYKIFNMYVGKLDSIKYKKYNQYI